MTIKEIKHRLIDEGLDWDWTNFNVLSAHILPGLIIHLTYPEPNYSEDDEGI